MNKKEIWNRWKMMINVIIYTIVMILFMVLTIPTLILTSLTKVLNDILYKIAQTIKQEEESN